MESYFTEEALRENLSVLHDDALSLSRHEGRAWGGPALRAAVLVPLTIRDGKVHVFYVQRSQTVWAARGVISFPGGMFQEGDKDEIDAALREAREEIGLNREDASILAVMRPILGAQFSHKEKQLVNLLMYPVIVFIPGPETFTPQLNNEIDNWWWHPVQDFTSLSAIKRTQTNYRGLEIYLLSRKIINCAGVEYKIHSMPLVLTVVLTIAIFRYKEEFFFGPDMCANFDTIRAMWMRYCTIPVEYMVQYELDASKL